MLRCYIGLGANVGDPLQQLRDAERALAALPGCRPGPLSPLYRSTPLGPQDQPDFLNAVAAESLLCLLWMQTPRMSQFLSEPKIYRSSIDTLKMIHVYLI